MSSPSSAGITNGSGVIREGTRVILREITANLQNSPPAQSPRRKSGNEAASIKGEQHDVKVRFIREFADAGASGREANTESSLSSASSFQSLTSTLSSKCSSGICVDSSPARNSDTSYISADIPGLDDLISACENIRLTDKTLDLSKDQSFRLELDGEDLSDDQTFTSASDRHSLDRTREIFETKSPVNVPPDVTQDLDSTRIVDGDKETSTANATADIVEASRYHQANSELKTVSETFVSNLAPVDSVLDGNARDKLEAVELAKTDETHENLEILVNNRNADHLQEHNINNGANSTLSLDEYTGNSTATLESLSELIADDAQVQLKEIESVTTTEQNEVAEQPAQSVLDVTVDCPSDLKEFESAEPTRRSEVAEKPTQSVLDVDSTSDLKELESVGITGESDLVINPTDSLLNVTVDFPSDSKEFESVDEPQLSEVAENPVQSTLDITVDIPSSLQEVADTQPSDCEVNEEVQPKSLQDLVVDDISSVDSHESYKPVTPALSELNDNRQCQTLPTLSSICLQAPLEETNVLLGAQEVKIVRSTEDNIPTDAEPSLSEKFADLAEFDIPHDNSISTIQQPAFLDTQKLVEESTEPRDNLAVVETEAAIFNSENIDKTVDPDFEIAQNVEELINSSTISVCEFKKPQLPVQTQAATQIVSPEPSQKENKEKEIQIVDSVEVEKSVIPEIEESRGANSSTGSEDLNETVTIQDISAGYISAAPESDQYAEFLPQQQSTALTLGGPTVNAHESGFVSSAGLLSGDNSVSEPISLPDEYAAFVPQQQSTALTGFADKPLNKLEREPTPFVTGPSPPIEAVINSQNNKSPKPTLPVDDRCNFEKLQLAAKAVANDIYNTSLEIEDTDSSERLVSANSELFHDPGSFDFLLSKTPRKNARRDLRAESLYVKFDPLVSNTSMLPQGNIHNTSPPVNDERNGDKNTTISNIGTPKRNPAIAAIDRLLFYSPMTTTTSPTTNTANIQKANDSQEKVEPTEETSAETVNMAKELELVRSTVIQLEDELEKLKIDHEEALEKQSSYQEKINQLQTQLAQEIKNKNQITVVVDEYEKSISRLVAEKERDRKNLDIEKAKLQEELAAAKRHLENSEAAFNDVHLKYERLKAVAAAYKSNEAALKQSAQKNVEIIKSLEIRNEQVKEHATARLEKANQDLDAMLKQHESEKVRLHAMVKKAELKSKSLAELVEQKTKENNDLTGILDEVIARVGRNKSE